jgi:hypothetical protein
MLVFLEEAKLGALAISELIQVHSCPCTDFVVQLPTTRSGETNVLLGSTGHLTQFVQHKSLRYRNDLTIKGFLEATR